MAPFLSRDTVAFAKAASCADHRRPRCSRPPRRNHVLRREPHRSRPSLLASPSTVIDCRFSDAPPLAHLGVPARVRRPAVPHLGVTPTTIRWC